MCLCANQNTTHERCLTRTFLLPFFFSSRCSLKYSSETDLICKAGLFLHSGRIPTSSLRCKTIADTKKQSYKQINATLRGGSVAGYALPSHFLKYTTENKQPEYMLNKIATFFLLLFIVKLGLNVVLKRRMNAWVELKLLQWF